MWCKVCGSALAGCSLRCKRAAMQTGNFNCTPPQQHPSWQPPLETAQDTTCPRAGSATAAPPQMKTPQPLWQSAPVLNHLPSKSFSSLYTELPAFQCAPTASCPVPLGTIENSLAPSSLLSHKAVQHG